MSLATYPLRALIHTNVSRYWNGFIAVHIIIDLTPAKQNWSFSHWLIITEHQITTHSTQGKFYWDIKQSGISQVTNIDLVCDSRKLLSCFKIRMGTSGPLLLLRETESISTSRWLSGLSKETAPLQLMAKETWDGPWVIDSNDHDSLQSTLMSSVEIGLSTPGFSSV